MFNARKLVIALVGMSLGATVAPLGAQSGSQRGAGRTPPTPPAPASSPAPTARPTPIAPRAPLSPRALGDWEYEMDRAAMEWARASSAFALDRAAIAEVARASALASASAVAPMAAMARDVAEQVAAGVAPMALAMAGDVAYQVGNAASSWASSRGYRTEVPQPWAQDDPADSLYRDARKALSSESYRKAADLFRTIREKYPRSTYTPDAPYWEAFALHRLGGDANLRAAREALALQQREYPRAATRGDATALGTRIDGVLGRNDARVATTLVGRADRAADNGCPSGKDDERVDALNAVMQMDPDQAMPILKKVLARREPCTQQLRRTAVWLVASRKQPEAASILMNVVRSDPDKEVREQAVMWMADVRTDEAADMLIGLAKSGDDTDLRKRAVYALSRSKATKAVSTLRELSLDARSSDEVRAEALTYYMRTDAGKEEGMAFLKDAFSRAESVPHRRRILSTVASRRNEEARAFLVSVALDERESLEVRRSAVSSVQSSVSSVSVNMSSGQASASTTTATPDQADAAKALGQIFDRASDLEIRRASLSALASLRNGAGLDKVLDVARNEKNLELRRSAVSTLSRTKDPRAAALLQEIIDR